MEPIIELVDVTVRYGPTLALNGVSLRLGRGLHLLVGPNGSGKTTLLRVISGLRRPDKGMVRVLGRDPAREALLGKPIVAGLVGEESPPYWMRGLDYITEALKLAGCGRECLDRCLWIAEELGLTGELGKATYKLSSGNKRKLILATALSVEAPVLVVDEPFANLDSKSSDTIARIITKEALRRTVVVASHIIPRALTGIATLTILVDGRILANIDFNNPWDVRFPVFIARIPEADKVLDKTVEVKAYEVRVRGNKAWVVLDGSGLKECIERGLCMDYSINVAEALSVIQEGDT